MRREKEEVANRKSKRADERDVIDRENCVDGGKERWFQKSLFWGLRRATNDWVSFFFGPNLCILGLSPAKHQNPRSCGSCHPCPLLAFISVMLPWSHFGERILPMFLFKCPYIPSKFPINKAIHRWLTQELWRSTQPDHKIRSSPSKTLYLCTSVQYFGTVTKHITCFEGTYMSSLQDDDIIDVSTLRETKVKLEW